jgi:L-lysine exporter family protein LysE/ArgO
VPDALLAAAAGFGLGLSLIVAIGAQNAYVLRQGLRGQFVGPVVAVCIVSDVALIAAGIGGVGAILNRLDWLIQVIRIVGAVLLFGYGLLAARRAVRPGHLEPDTATVEPGLAAVVGTCLALTWLNPHVYLDTVLLLGSIASTHGAQRWSFGVGAAVASTAWFLLLGYGARVLRPAFAKPLSWRILDAIIAVVMVAIATSLAIAAFR